MKIYIYYLLLVVQCNSYASIYLNSFESYEEFKNTNLVEIKSKENSCKKKQTTKSLPKSYSLDLKNKKPRIIVQIKYKNHEDLQQNTYQTLDDIDKTALNGKQSLVSEQE